VAGGEIVGRAGSVAGNLHPVVELAEALSDFESEEAQAGGFDESGELGDGERVGVGGVAGALDTIVNVARGAGGDDEINESEAAAWAEDTGQLGEGAGRIEHVVNAVSADGEVEGGVGEREARSVGAGEGDVG